MVNAVERAAAVMQEAALGNAPMSLFVEAVARLVGADKGLLGAASGTVDGINPFAAFNFPEAAVREYNAHFSGRDAYIRTLAAQPRPQPVNIGSEVWERRTYRRSEIYNEFYRHHDVEWGCSLSTRERLPNGVPRLQLSLARGAHAPPFGAEQKRILQALAPHFDATALIVLQRRAEAQASLAAAFEQAADAIAIMDGHGQVRYANARFDALRQRFCGSALRDWNRPLQAPGFAVVKQAFHGLLGETRRSSLAARRFLFTAAGDAAIQRYLGSLSPVLTTAGVAARRGERLFLLMLREYGACEDEQVAALRDRYRLTVMEARVLRALADGSDVAEISAQFSLSQHTVRTHVKALLAKTHCRRQAQLLRLLRSEPTGQLRLMC